MPAKTPEQSSFEARFARTSGRGNCGAARTPMNVLMPQLGETVAEGKITKWFKAAGDGVAPGDNLFEIETDKVSMEVPATSAGVLSEIRVPAGEVAPVGAIVAVIADGAGGIILPREAGEEDHLAKQDGGRGAGARENSAALAPPPPRFARSPSPVPLRSTGKDIPLDPFFEVRTPERNFGPARLSGGVTVTPLARRLAAESGIDLAQLRGSGPHRRARRGTDAACAAEARGGSAERRSHQGAVRV